MDYNHFTIKIFMAITAERDAAIRETNMALEERKRAFTERDMAMLQRDAAIAERDVAIQERDEAIAGLQFREDSMNENSSPPDSTKTNRKQMHVSEAAYSPREKLRVDDDLNNTEASEFAKSRRGRYSKTGKQTKSVKSSMVGPISAEALKESVNCAASNGCNKEWDSESEEDLDMHFPQKHKIGLNKINLDESAMHVPVCTCTGSPQPCYRWGSGGWQSACCTTTITM